MEYTSGRQAFTPNINVGSCGKGGSLIAPVLRKLSSYGTDSPKNYKRSFFKRTYCILHLSHSFLSYVAVSQDILFCLSLKLGFTK